MNLLEIKIKETKDFCSFNDSEDQDDRNFFSEVWNSVAFTIGIKKPLVEKELEIIYNFLIEYFKTLTLNDIRDAFSLYSAQKLNYKESHFQSLDNVFIGKVLNSYKEYKSKQSLIKPLKETVAKELPKPRITREQNAKEWYDWIEKEVRDGRGDLLKFALCDWSAIFWHMEKNEFIKLTEDKKEMFFENVRHEIKEKIIKLKAENKDYKVWHKKLIDKKAMGVECRKRFVLNYYENI